jgi:chromate transporter
MLSLGIRFMDSSAKFYYTYRESAIVSSSFKGIKAAVIGLLAAVAISLGNTSLVDLPTAGIAAVSFVVITFTELDPTFVILGAGVMGAFFL